MKKKLAIAAGLALLLILAGTTALVIMFFVVRDSTTDWKPFVYEMPVYPEETRLADGYYLNQVQPIFNRRCIACHGCLDSPCLLKLTNHEGVIRGAYARNPEATHIFAEAPVRLNNEPNLAAWRKRGFHPVIEQQGDPVERPHRSVLYQMLAAGQDHNQPGFAVKPLEEIYYNFDSQVCPCSQGIESYLEKRPYAGMPFGFPAISDEDRSVIYNWLVAGAPGPTAAEMKREQTASRPELIQRWESFLNQADKRSPLVSRYIFEHIFLATISFKEMPGEFFRLVRSASPPVAAANAAEATSADASPIREIITARPFDSPYIDGVDKCYYRLQKITSSWVQKSFIVWSLDDNVLSRLDELFFKTQWPSMEHIEPGYDSHNPFVVFQAIPARSRSLFMLENSKLIANGMIRGPVCVGNIATYAIKDFFWVFFVDPDSDPSVLSPELGLKSWDDFMSYEIWSNADYEEAYAKTLNRYKPNGYAISDVWDGDRNNPNAWLTILRNETNATVMHGRKGGTPSTFWFIDYSGFERLYYSLVADYTYWGSVEEKLATWEFMGYLRQEFEDNFLRLLPEQDRKEYRSKWTRGLGQELLFTMPFPGESAASEVPVDELDPVSGVLTLIQKRLGEQVSGPRDLLNQSSESGEITATPLKTPTDWVAAANNLTMRTHQDFTQYLPSVTFLRVNFADQPKVYTLIANRSYAFNDVVFDENGARQPKLDTLSVYEGLVGDFPNLLVEVSGEKAGQMLVDLQAVNSEEAWLAWKDKYGTLRNQAEFWPLFDWFTDWNFTNRQPEAGHFDLRYYNLLNSKY